MPKLLYLIHRIPFPPNKGDKIRSFHFLRALAKRYEIFLGTFVDDPEDRQYIEALKPYCRDVCCVELSPGLNKLKSARGLFSGEALSLPYYRDKALRRWVDQVISTEGIDRALIFSSPMAQYAERYPELRVVADFVDVDSDKWSQYANSKSWPAAWIYRREARTLLSYETRIASRAAKTIFVSEQEAALFKTLAPLEKDKIDFVNNGVDTDRFDPKVAGDSPFPSGQSPIVFTGAMDYWANVDAVKWFAETVFPEIKRQCPHAKFYIVGSKPAKEVLQLSENDSAVIVTGKVDDVRPYIVHARLIVAPLRIARGIQNKVLEAMAMAKPVVATSAAMEGISAGQELQVAVADEPNEFAERVVSYLQQPTVYAEDNRRFVERAFGWSANADKLLTLLAG
ncbi:TIGR03087 family PEP-CTERM/XrtA system glycosyltransferase [Methylomonas sp. UP202]|uniref:TIGR03087 family PEP-CTERM/XrtA system glycosyltransferase n=1 Tax=Methylomonas sp. UP202 TaxID=3040943 RepID=UPI0024784FB2|nr:TIGR03087 family PEP-CTERM/XrtA system glycosyltransferase [Methylomonas sp. UP202]WGS85535.1 TIGR03087 family PEP-CTERM/XrtA system glycosyltransferase [Methylomonas sp. UP202]